MTKDFSKYQNIIDQFRGEVSAADFDVRFATKTEKIPKTERFLLKMELKRLATECTRLIDLRGQVDGECKEHEHDGRIHYLDELAIRVFEENIKHYGKYTFGVYDAVKNTENNFRVMYEKEKLNISSDNPVVTEDKVYEKTQYPAQLIRFSNYTDRIEERMNFAISIKVIVDDNPEITATSSDISVKGCRFRLGSDIELENGQTVKVRFTGLEQEFELGSDPWVSYRIQSTLKANGGLVVGCSRVIPEQAKSDSFSSFLKGFIQGNKRRYKINLDNTISALQSRTFEHFVLPEINELPVFIEKSEDTYSPRFALTCCNNKAVYNYWQNETRQSTLNFLITNERISVLLDAQKKQQSLLVYSFIHKSQGKLYFYTADELQLDDDKNFMRQFVGFCADKTSFGVFELSIVAADNNKILSPFTLSNALQKKDEYLNAPPPVETKKLIKPLSHIVIVKDLSNQSILPHYQQFNFEGIDINKVKAFGHKRQKQALKIDEVGINYKNQRQEARFKYDTPAVISAEDVSWKGKSEDFSMSGLKLRLDKPAMLMKGDVINIDFPSLQKITKDFDLSSLPYEIISVNQEKTVINCRVFIEHHQHIGRSFFKLLIERNRNKLTPDEYIMMTPGLSKALRNIYSASVTIPFLLAQTSGSRYKFDVLTSSGEHGELLAKLKTLSDTENRFNLYPLLSDLPMMNELNAQLKKMAAIDPPVTYTLYVSIKDGQGKIENNVKTILAETLNLPEQQQFFINSALSKGSFHAVQLKLSRLKTPDLDYLNPELAYISSYAIHRGKQIEQDICSVVGSIEIVDITEEVLTLHRLST